MLLRDLLILRICKKILMEEKILSLVNINCANSGKVVFVL